MSTPHYAAVRQHLSDNCPVMKRVIDRAGPCTLVPKGDDPFTLLVRCVIGQQISSKAADSIFARLVAAVGSPSIPVAELAGFTEAAYKACGLSGPKQRTLRAVIDSVTAAPDLLPSIPELDDDTLRARLTAIKGIGPWTVDMLMIFGLGRADVLPVGDYGVQVAVKNLFNLRKLPDAARITRLARPWAPHRSVAMWYLWRSLNWEPKAEG